MKKLLVVLALFVAGPGFADTISGDHLIAYPGIIYNNGECFWTSPTSENVPIHASNLVAPNNQVHVVATWSGATYNGGINLRMELWDCDNHNGHCIVTIDGLGPRRLATRYMYYDNGISHKEWTISYSYYPTQNIPGDSYYLGKYYYVQICSLTNNARVFSDWDTWSITSYIVANN